MNTAMFTQAARWTALAALFVIPFIPLYVANDLFFPFITGKGFAFRILVELAVAGYVILALVNRAYRPKFSWIFVAYGAFIAWMLVAALAGTNPHKALWSNFERMEGWVMLAHVFLFFLVSGAVLTTDKLWRTWWLTFISASALVAGYCVIQLLGGAPIHQGGVRVDGTFGNAAYLASYLLFAIAISLWQALASKGWLRYVLFALAFVQVVIVFFTATRGAILALVGAALVGSLLWAFESGKKSRKIALAVVVGIVVIAGTFFLAKSTPFIANDPTLSRIASIGPKDLTVRFTLWSMAGEGIMERPITGWGQEGFNYIFNEHYRPSLFAQEPWFDRAHNVFIDWLVAGGIPGFLLFLATFMMAIYALYRGNAPREERVLLLAALAAYGIQAMVVFDHIFTYVPLAAILATAHAASARPWKRVEEAPTISESNIQIVAPIVLAGVLVIMWFINVPNIVAASSLVRAIGISGSDITQNVLLFQKALNQGSFGQQEVREQLLMFTNNIAFAQGHPSPALTQLQTYALAEMGKEVESQPKDARLRLQYALGYRVASDYPNALKQIEIAHELSPKKQSILIELGFNHWQMGQYEKARDAFRQAYELDPSFDQLAPYRGAGDIIAGDLAGGKAFLSERLGTTTSVNEALILAYYQARAFPDLIRCLEEQLRAQNGAMDAYFRLAAAYTAAGNPVRARAIVQEGLAKHPEAAAQAAEFLSHVK